MDVADVMTKPIVTCHPQDSLDLAAHRMWDADCGALPVTDADGALIGILTDRDICMSAWSRGRPLADIRVEDAMARQVYTVKPDQEIGVAELLMAEHQIRRVPVVDASHRPIGLVSMNDLAREAARPGSKLKDGVTRALHTLAAICTPRRRGKAA
ncbi:MAG TPA: CBS domain-containing protein [Kofleriaceae bacterium]|nr:CBS domain-containing protein [Kofleriaceae bacterium]